MLLDLYGCYNLTFDVTCHSHHVAPKSMIFTTQRTIGDEISKLKNQLPDLGGAKTVSEALTAAQASETPDAALIAKLKAAAPIDSQIKELQQERKSLSEKGPREKHYSQGALIAFLGTVFAIVVR